MAQTQAAGVGRYVGRVLRWLRRSASRRGVSSALGVLDEVFHPGAETAREVRDAQPDQVQPAPSPGDRLLEEGRTVIERPEA